MKTRCITYEILSLHCNKSIKSEVKDASFHITDEVDTEKQVSKRGKEFVTKEVGETETKYIGETKKSAYERGRERKDMLKSLNEGNHLLKHLVEVRHGMPLNSR